MAQTCIYEGRECDGCMDCLEAQEVVDYDSWFIKDDGLEEST